MANWTNEPQPFGANRAPLLAGLSKTDGITPVPVAVDPANGQLQTNSAGGGGGGTSSSFGAAFPATGTAVGATDGTNMQALKVDGSNNLLTKINVALPAGSANIGGVEIFDSAGTNKLGVNASGQITIANTTFAATQATASSLNATVVGTGTFAAQVTGTVTANAGTNLNTSALALESGGNLATIAGAVISQEATTSGVKGVTMFGAVTTAKPTYTTLKSDALSLDVNGLLRVSLADTPANTNKFLVTPDSVALPANQSVNVSQINAVTPLMGNGVTGTGSQRVTIASDNTAFSVNAAATLNAETTKVIGVVRNSDGAGNLLTSNSTTPTAHFALDSNITSILGTAPTTVGKLDVKGADGDVFVRQTTGSNLHTVLDSGTLTTLSTLTTVTNAVKVTGNAGGAFDAATNAAVPANAVQIGGVSSTALPSAFTATDLAPMMMDKFGRQVVLPFSIRDLTLPMTQLTLTSTTTETSLIAAVASTFNDLASVIVINTSATATQVDFRDSTAGTIRLSLYVPAGDTRGATFTTPLPQNAVNTAWTAKCGTSVASVIITGSYIANK